MAGLNLGTNIGVTYAPPPSYASAGANDAGSLSSRAFGISTDATGGSKSAAIGAVGAGSISALILLWIWHTLPR